MKIKSIHEQLEEKIREFEHEVILLRKTNQKMKRLFRKYGWDKSSKIKILEQPALTG